MKINLQFPGNAYLPTVGPLPNAVDPAAVGPSSVNVTLSQLADMIKKPANMPIASHARPTMMASVISFASSVQQTVSKLNATQDTRAVFMNNLKNKSPDDYNRFVKWLGLCGLLALRGVYSMSGLNLSVRMESLTANNKLDSDLLFALNNMSDSYKKFITAVDPATGAPTAGALFFFEQNGVPFAIYHDEIGICPICSDSDVSFSGIVPWYRDDPNPDNRWTDPLTCGLGAYIDDRYLWWMMQNKLIATNEMPDPAALNNRMRSFAMTAGWDSVVTNLTSVHALRAQSLCTVCGGYTDAARQPHVLPNFFTPNLLLALRPSAFSSGMGYNDRNGVWHALQLNCSPDVCSYLSSADSSPDNFIPVIPFTAEAMNLYNSEFSLNSVQFTAHASAQGQLDSISLEASLFFTDSGQTFSFKLDYPSDHVCAGLLPYLTVWPWVPLPVNSWNVFCATTSTLDEDPCCLTRNQVFVESLSLILPEGDKYTVCEKGPNPESWPVFTSNKRFTYGCVFDDAQNMMGVVMIPQVQDIAVAGPGTQYNVSIDFGTTSTVCAIAPVGVQTPQTLTYSELSRNVTIANMEANRIPVAERRLIGRCAPDPNQVLLQRKTLTTAQLFDCYDQNGISVNTVPTLAGRFFLATSTLLCGYTSNATLTAQGIYNDLKLSTQADVNEMDASIQFLAGAYSQALLYILASTAGTGRISKLHVSYPGGFTQKLLASRWQKAAALVNSCLAPASPYQLNPNTMISYLTEAYAARQHMNHVRAVPAMIPGYINIDIGGGTTDLSAISNGAISVGPLPTFSFKYAGRELVINTLLQYYRLWQKDANHSLAQKHFAGLWGEPFVENTDPAVLNQLINNFFEGLDSFTGPQLLSVPGDQSLRTLIEVLLNDYNMALPANDGNYNLLRELFSLKFFVLMQAVAVFVRENLADLGPVMFTKMDMFGQSHPVLALSFTGTAAMSLQHVFNMPISDLHMLSSLDTLNGNDATVMLSHVAAMMEETIGMPETKGLAIQLIISDSVCEKKEVAYGMLEGNAAAGGAAVYAIPGSASPLDQDNLADYVMEHMNPTFRGNWMRENFSVNLTADETLQKAQIQNAIRTAPPAVLTTILENTSLLKNTLELQDEIAAKVNDPQDFADSIASLIQFWSAFCPNGLTNSTWPIPPAIGVNVGLGDVQTLGIALPMGYVLKSAVSSALGSILNDNDSHAPMTYLAQIDDKTYRNALLQVYVMENIINDVLYNMQKEASV